MMLAEKRKIKPFILGGMGFYWLSSSTIMVNGEPSSDYSTPGLLGILLGVGIGFELIPRTSLVVENRYQKFIWPIFLESGSASTALIKTGLMFRL